MKAKRIGLVALVLTILAGPSTPAAAQGVTQSGPAAEPQVWGEDDWLYVVRGGRLLRTVVSRSFPDQRNSKVFDIFENGRHTKRVSIADPRWRVEMPAAHFASTSHISWVAVPATATATPATLHIFVKSWGRWTTLQEIQTLSARQAVSAAADPNNASIAVRTVGGTEAFGAGRPVSPELAAILAQAGVLPGMVDGRTIPPVLARCAPGQVCR